MAVSEHDVIEIPSYRVAFELERRIHTIDRWRVPVPYGIPVRGLAYAAATLVLVVLLSGFPLVGPLLGLVHPALRLGVLPIAAGVGLFRLRVDGRAAHRAAAAWLRLMSEPRRLVAFRRAQPYGPVRLGDVAIAPDDGGSRLRRALVEGPARVTLRHPVQTSVKRRTLRVRQTGEEAQWRGTQVRLRPGQRLEVLG